MSRVGFYGKDQSDRRTNVARFCDLTCTLELWTGTCLASTETADSSHVRLQISALGLIFAISHGWSLSEGFCRFFESKGFLFEFYFFVAYLFESSFDSMMINTIPPGCRGSLAASRPATDRDLAILPGLPGGIVYISGISDSLSTSRQLFSVPMFWPELPWCLSSPWKRLGKSWSKRWNWQKVFCWCSGRVWNQRLSMVQEKKQLISGMLKIL